MHVNWIGQVPHFINDKQKPELTTYTIEKLCCVAFFEPKVESLAFTTKECNDCFNTSAVKYTVYLARPDNELLEPWMT